MDYEELLKDGNLSVTAINLIFSILPFKHNQQWICLYLRDGIIKSSHSPPSIKSSWVFVQMVISYVDTYSTFTNHTCNSAYYSTQHLPRWHVYVDVISVKRQVFSYHSFILFRPIALGQYIKYIISTNTSCSTSSVNKVGYVLFQTNTIFHRLLDRQMHRYIVEWCPFELHFSLRCKIDRFLHCDYIMLAAVPFIILCSSRP